MSQKPLAPKLPITVDAAMGAKLRAARKALGMSQKQLGEVAGVSFQQKQKYEKGTNRVASSTLQKFAVSLNLPIEHFFEDRPGGGQLASPPRAAYAATEDAGELLRYFEAIQNPALRQQVLQYARMIAGEQAPAPKRRK